MLPSNDKASPGQPFKAPPATVWNGMIDAGNAYRAGLLSNGTPDRKKRFQTDVVSLLNSSGSDRARGEILRFNGKSIEELDNDFIWLVGDVPTADGFFGILREPIQDDAVGLVQVSGCCMATIDVSGTGHKYAIPVAGDYLLASADAGPIEILYKPSGTGELECVARFGSDSSGGGEIVHFYSPGGGIAARSTLTMGSASCDIYTCSSGGVLSESGENETVYNMASSAFAASTHGVAMRNAAGLLVAIVEDCGA